MNIIRISRELPEVAFANYSDFVYTALPGAYALANYWTSTFGTDEADNNKIILITNFSRGGYEVYSEVNSIASCQATEQSWYWDFDNQIIYVHFEHDQNPFTDTYIYTFAEGFTDALDTIYIDDIEYLPTILSVPSLSQQASIVGYDKQAYINGSITFNNTAKYGDEVGPMDFLITEKIYRNNVDMFFLDQDDLITDGKTYSATETNLATLGAFYAESFEYTLSDLVLNLQDRRKAEDINIPNDFYNSTDYPNIDDSYIGNVIPVAFGLIRELPCTPLQPGTGATVTFKAAESLTDWGTIYVNVEGTWTAATTGTNYNLSTGEFDLATSECADANDKIYEVKLVNAIGDSVTYATDVIKALNLKYLNIPYNSSFYDTTEWEAEETSLETIGILLDEQKTLADWIYLIQNGASKGFRYEITPDGLRTFRIKDNDRISSAFIPNGIITNLDELPISADPTGTVFAQVKVSYAESYQLDKSLSITNNTYYDYVRYNYKTYDELQIDTFLTTLANASTRAAIESLDYSDVKPTAEVIVYGAEQLAYKIYDIVTIELTPGLSDYDQSTISGRTYYGVKKAMILGIAPNANNKTNTLQLRILDDAIYYIFADEESSYFAFEDGILFTME